MIPNELIDQILDRVDIVEIMSLYLPLRKTGQSFKAHCPFHKEKTPSFVVSPSKQIYHCFGCGAGGNVIGFLMKHEKMDFIEAITFLAQKAQVTLPKPSAAESARQSQSDKLYEANAAACAFFQENLAKNQGAEARRYLTERGIDDKAIQYFRLGYSLNMWQGLINHCEAKGMPRELLEKTGLILQNAGTGNWYDRFRGRLMFPILDARNRCMGFGARALDDTTPKYINSPETSVYSKGRHLFGINVAREAIRKQDFAIIVEGYFDLIAPFQCAIRNIVATLGTAMTVDQIRAIKRFTKNVIVLYDSDTAGEEATLRGLDILVGEEMNVRITALPKGYDPDTFVRKEGRDAFLKLLKESKDIFDYKLGILCSRFKRSEPRGKARIAGEMLPTLARVRNAVLQSGYLKRLSELLYIDEDAIRTELKKVRPDRKTGQPAEIVERKEKPATLAELSLLAIVLEDAAYIKRIEKEVGFASFRDRSIVTVLEKVLHIRNGGKKVTPSHLMSYFEDNASGQIISEAANLGQTLSDKERIFHDCSRHILKDNLKQTLASIQSQIRDAENASDRSRVRALVTEYNELIKNFGRHVP